MTWGNFGDLSTHYFLEAVKNMSDANRPRPRPKPKQRPKASDTGPSEPGPSSSFGPTSNPLKKKAVDVQDDNDEMLMRNRKRTNKDWEHLEKLNKGLLLRQVHGT